MKLSILSIALVLTTTFTVLAADPGGWGKVKWGMTKAQVKQAYPHARDYRRSDGKLVFGDPDYEVNYVSFTMDFMFSSKDGLYSIAFRPYGDYSTNTMSGTAKIFMNELNKQLGHWKLTESKSATTYDWGTKGSKTTAEMVVFPETGPTYSMHPSLTPDPDRGTYEVHHGLAATFRLFINGF